MIRMAAIILPIIIAGKAHLNRMSNKDAIRLPVQTPVPGSGMATKRISPQVPYFCILFP